jgi:hypothetical protein
VPPHPGDVERAIRSTAQADAAAPSGALPDATKPRASNRTSSPSPTSVPDFTPQEHDVIIGLVAPSKNPLSQYILNKIRDQMPRMSIKHIRNYIRLLIQRGQVAAPEA